MPVTGCRLRDMALTSAGQRAGTIHHEARALAIDRIGGNRARLFYDVASAGSVQSIEGRPPLRVVLGNAAAVAVQVDGQSREIPASAVDGEGARFVVNRSGSLARAR